MHSRITLLRHIFHSKREIEVHIFLLVRLLLRENCFVILEQFTLVLPDQGFSALSPLL